MAIVKLTWNVSPIGGVSLAMPQSPIRLADVPEELDPPERAGARSPSDLCEEKPGTDVFFVGQAYPPAAKATWVQASVRVQAHQELRQALKVYGPRVWRVSALGAVKPSTPGVMGVTPITYARTFGGDVPGPDDTRLREERNPIGIGLAADPMELLNQPVPEIESLQAPLDSRAPAPAGFGPIASHWQPRVNHAGTFDAAWRQQRAPLRPEDFDPRFHSCASPGLWSEAPLRGDEPIEVLGATPEGRWIFRLPLYQLCFLADLGAEPVELDNHLDTLLIDGHEGRVELTWRASLPLPRKSEIIRSIRIYGSELPAAVMADVIERVDRTPDSTAPPSQENTA